MVVQTAPTIGTAVRHEYKAAGMSVDSSIAVSVVVPREAGGKPRAAVVPRGSVVLLCAVVRPHTLRSAWGSRHAHVLATCCKAVLLVLRTRTGYCAILTGNIQYKYTTDSSKRQTYATEENNTTCMYLHVCINVTTTKKYNTKT